MQLRSLNMAPRESILKQRCLKEDYSTRISSKDSLAHRYVKGSLREHTQGTILVIGSWSNDLWVRISQLESQSQGPKGISLGQDFHVWIQMPACLNYLPQVRIPKQRFQTWIPKLADPSENQEARSPINDIYKSGPWSEDLKYESFVEEPGEISSVL